jgi:hypothetical protein
MVVPITWPHTGREVMVICETGGTIDAKPGNANGTQSR